MKIQSFIPGKYIAVVVVGLVLFGLYLTSLYSYLLFQSLVELFSIIVAMGIFIVAWNSRRFLDNNYLLFIGIAYMFIGSLDLVHTLAYTGMGVFQGYDSNLPTQLWLAARYLESLSLLMAFSFLGRKLRVNSVFLGYTLVISLLLASIFYWNIFPQSFVEGVGLTPFKKVSEYIISLILLGSMVFLFKNRRQFDRGVLQLLVASIAVTIASEIAFTFFAHLYGFANLIGHFLKVISFYLIYKAIIETGLTKPYSLLFRNLKQSEEELRKHREHLVELVEERTVELTTANEQLQQEITERKRVEHNIGERVKELTCLYGISQLVSKTGTSLDETLKGTVELIPPGWQYPEITCARITSDGKEFKTDNLALTEWKQTSDIRVGGETLGVLEVYYREEKPESDEGPFLKEERDLIDGIARMLSEKIERARAEEAIKQAAEEWAITFNSIPDFVSFHDKDFRLVRVNKAFADTFKAKPEELIGKHCYEIVHGTSEPVPNCPYTKIIDTKQSATAEFFEPHLGIYLEVSTSPIFDEKGEVKVTACAHVARDITERKQAEGLKATARAAELANQAKSEFLANMSHELRTPLNAIIGFSQVLQERYFGDLNEKQAEYMSDVLESGKHLLSLIDDILDLSKIEAGKMEPELSTVRIRDLLENSLIMVKEKALKHGISLDIHTTDLDGTEIIADERKLKQVMFNLLSNATKFTPDGGAITVEGRKDGEEFIISVSDTGIGIAAGEREKIFDEFYQASGIMKDKPPGTGLGLSITRRIVDMHEGRIWAESEGEGKGSQFSFTLPIGHSECEKP